MIIREWQGHGPYEDIEVIITVDRRGWTARATGCHQLDGEDPFPIDAQLAVTSRSEAVVMNAMEGAIRGKDDAMMRIVQWAITANMARRSHDD